MLEFLNLSVKGNCKDHGGRRQHYRNVVAAYVVAFEAYARNQQEPDDKDVSPLCNGSDREHKKSLRSCKYSVLQAFAQQL